MDQPQKWSSLLTGPKYGFYQQYFFSLIGYKEFHDIRQMIRHDYLSEQVMYINGVYIFT